MYLKLALCVFLTFIHSAYNDFVMGMFKPHDYLVSQDMYYKERIPFRSVTGQYGRKFKCPITYFRVIDRLGVGRGPGVRIVRGGLGKPYLVVRFTAAYNMPLSLNIYTGCENKKEQPTLAPPTTPDTNGTTPEGHGNGTEHAASHDSASSSAGSTSSANNDAPAHETTPAE